MNVCTISPSQQPYCKSCAGCVSGCLVSRYEMGERGDEGQLSPRAGKGGWALHKSRCHVVNGLCVMKRACHLTFCCGRYCAALGLCCECARARSTFAGAQRLFWCVGCRHMPICVQCILSLTHACIQQHRGIIVVEQEPSRFLHMYMYVILLMPHAPGTDCNGTFTNLSTGYTVVVDSEQSGTKLARSWSLPLDEIAQCVHRCL